ncbi:Aste57867_4275 [Aphanomyces stellatus]|uniref:Aste57867_4275 protein n=1 Tax=Aphanomyces stellatus TaxID=120398 RepID=A0A485KCU1_9STRA|nr:hypothetical protein As57867_004264 [Aphanomyces stellatus]VFT81390.1 Aste57867_4275 [Aphanomyces stellatus]
MLRQVLGVLRANQQEIETMSKVVASIQTANNTELMSLDMKKKDMEDKRRTFRNRNAQLSRESANFADQLEAVNSSMVNAKSQLQQQRAELSQQQLETNDMRKEHHLWVAATVVAAIVFFPAAFATGAIARDTHDDLKGSEDCQDYLEGECRRLVALQEALTMKRSDLKDKLKEMTKKSVATEAALGEIDRRMVVLRQQTSMLDQFSQTLNKMKVDIGETLNTIQYVVRSVGYGSGVARALESSAQQARGEFAVVWKGVESITRRLQQSNPRLTMEDAF